jgi:hypothetical protein
LHEGENEPRDQAPDHHALLEVRRKAGAARVDVD